MSASRTLGRFQARSSIVLLVLSLVMLPGCAQKGSSAAAGPVTSFGGTVTLAGGVGDVNGTKIDLYYGDPFAPGATIALTTTATGSAAVATFSFGSLAAGDFGVVASKGSLRGWYNGLVNGTGNPVASVIHLLHGESRTINITMQ